MTTIQPDSTVTNEHFFVFFVVYYAVCRPTYTKLRKSEIVILEYLLVVGQTGAGAIRDNIEWFEYSHQRRKEIV
jgi:hypothetical protein